MEGVRQEEMKGLKEGRKDENRTEIDGGRIQGLERGKG